MTGQWQPAPAALDLPEAAVHLWRGSLDQPAERVGTLAGALSPDELARAARFRTARLRDRFTVGRGALRTLLGRYLGLDPAALRFAYSAHGKPSLAHPLCAPSLEFNLAHAEDQILLAFARAQPLGVDVEQTRPRPNFDALDLAERFFAPDEYAALRGLPTEQRHRAFCRVWTCKEAYLKACGEGLSLPLDSFSVAAAPGAAPSLLRVAGRPDEPDRWTLRVCEPAPGYVAALAVRSRAFELRCFEMA